MIETFPTQNGQSVVLAETGRTTSRLGYGCSSLMGAMGQRDSVRLLDAAFDAGVRHFDVAPMYGFGAAEECLGVFLRRHPGAVTVTTKYGLPPAKNQSLMGLARRVAGPIVQRVPALKKRLLRAASTVSGPAAKASFSVAEARESMERSLHALAAEQIDVWLLHEVEAGDLTKDELLRFLEDSVREGKIGTFGVGSDRSKVDDLLRLRPEYCPVVQHEWSVLDAAVDDSAAFRIHHRALTEHFRGLHESLASDPALCRRWSDQVGGDLDDREVLANIMLKAAFVMNPASVILASSKNPSHIAANVRVAANEALAEPARRLYALVQTEGVPNRKVGRT